MIWHLHIDTGGTFTDCIAMDPEGMVRRLKILSNSTLRGTVRSRSGEFTYKVDMDIPCTNDIFRDYSVRPVGTTQSVRVKSLDPTTNMLTTEKALDESVEDIELISPEEVPLFAARLFTATPLDEELPPLHLRLGTTRATNALLERKGATVVLITTAGFRDILRIGNQQRPNLFALDIQTPPPLYDQVIEIDERLDANGAVIKPLEKDSLQRLVREIQKKQGDNRQVSVAVSLLHSYRNASHEGLIRDFLAEMGFAHITCSSAISDQAKYLDRTETTVVNAYLKPIMNQYLKGISNAVGDNFYVMTSSGHLSDYNRFTPKDALLSGPAGGVTGAVRAGQLEGEDHLLAFDMGGTSTDVSLFAGSFSYTYLTRVGPARIQAPALDIDTIASGGGSICSFDGQMLHVGPESAGASPGPACYGAGGPLTLSDVNLLSGRLVTDAFRIPVSERAARSEIGKIMKESGHKNLEDLLQSFRQIANERMAETIRKTALKKGLDPSEMTLVTFGGAGGQHACDIAGLLDVRKILVPYDAGLLSAHGISKAEIARFANIELFRPWKGVKDVINEHIGEVVEKARDNLIAAGYRNEDVEAREIFLSMRFRGQETSLELSYDNAMDVELAFEKAYRELYGHWLEGQELELVSIKALAAVSQQNRDQEETPKNDTHSPTPIRKSRSLYGGKWRETSVYRWEDLQAGAEVSGPSVLFSQNCTLYIDPGWKCVINQRSAAFVEKIQETAEMKATLPESAQIRLFLNRFTSVVEEMCALVERTAFSVNIKERFDFSCALLDGNARLIVNAPHIPVHLGSMGLCVSEVIKELTLKKGDIAITNHPAYGGSHLPDVTLIAPVYSGDTLVGYVANRAHHAEIGGKTPGSMPPDAQRLIEEGVIINPVLVMEKGESRWDFVKEIFETAPYPTRSISENMADLRGSVASILAGVKAMEVLCAEFGPKTVRKYMESITTYVAGKFEEVRTALDFDKRSAIEVLDDGSELHVEIINNADGLLIDFSGTSPIHPGNFNATPAIVRSVVIYVMRLLLKEELPLNDGLLRNINIHLPKCMLNPDFSKSPEELPAVVGGNTEVSQRLTDTLLKALDLSACSQGTMNNFLFGNESFGFYETICGGTGAGPGFGGHDAIHQHMTNTRITDAEILELRYPVRLERFAIRENSGGAGKWPGGNGVERQITFLEEVEVSLLSQHRIVAPYSLHGGGDGSLGQQYIDRKNGLQEVLKGCDHTICHPGDRITILTPGGGGWGHPA